VIYPPSGFYKDCYDCPLKKVPVNDARIWKKPLQTGMYDTDVVYLQKALNRDGVYPEAIYSGYYNYMTEQAVKRFQKKYNIVSSGDPSSTGYGRVGWATISKLNELYNIHNISE
jgi:peptidoglycan hydrolase-like protein with peptidoglycan-binding domain